MAFNSDHPLYETSLHAITCLKNARHHLEFAMYSINKYADIHIDFALQMLGKDSLIGWSTKEGMDPEIQAFFDRNQDIKMFSRMIDLKIHEIHLNYEIVNQYLIDIKIEDYEQKQRMTRMVNNLTRETQRVLSHPTSQEPSVIYAIASPDRMGRYTFENRATKKRSGAYKTLKELLPLRLVDDIPRKEGFIESRKNKPVE